MNDLTVDDKIKVVEILKKYLSVEKPGEFAGVSKSILFIDKSQEKNIKCAEAV